MRITKSMYFTALASAALASMCVPGAAMDGTGREQQTERRQAWNDAFVTHTIQASFVGDPPPRFIIDALRERIARLPSGTRIYEVPGFVIRDGSNVATFYDSTLTHRSGQYIVSRGNQIIASYSDTSRVSAIGAALTYYIKPGHVVPARFTGVRPSAVTP